MDSHLGHLIRACCLQWAHAHKTLPVNNPFELPGEAHRDAACAEEEARDISLTSTAGAS